MSIRTNKKGDKYLSIWWFMVLAIIAIGITAGVYVFYSADMEVRGLEANILNKKISSCLTNGDFLDEEFLEENFDIFEGCVLNEQVLNSSGDFYLGITLYVGEGERREVVKRVRYGTISFEGDCRARYEDGEEKVAAKNYAKCVFEESEIIYYESGISREGILEILTASNQNGEREVVA